MCDALLYGANPLMFCPIRPNHNVATVTATATVTERVMAADATAMADRGRPLSTAGLFLSILLSVLHL